MCDGLRGRQHQNQLLHASEEDFYQLASRDSAGFLTTTMVDVVTVGLTTKR